MSSLMTYHKVLTRVTCRVSLVEQEQLILAEHMGSPPETRNIVCDRQFRNILAKLDI